MVDTPHMLTPADLMACLGKPLSQTIFSEGDFEKASPESIERYFPRMIHRTLRLPGRFRFVGLPVEELHIMIGKQEEIVALFLQVDNQHLVDRLMDTVGRECVASGSAIGDQKEVFYSLYYWDFKGGCINLELKALRPQLRPKIVRDVGWLTFSNCDPLSYLTVPDGATDQ